MRKLFYTVLFTSLLSAPLYAEAPKQEITYNYKNGELFRFDYSKTITIKQPNEEGAIEERQTEVAAVLILEIKSVTAAGASATLRFDSPKVTLPAIRFFSAQYENVEEQADKTRSVMRAIEGAIKTARWTVLLKPDGSMQIESRTPATIHEWLKETGNSSGWRKKTQEAMLKLMEQDLGLKVQTLDRETFACFSAPPEEPAPQTAEVLHPVRTKPTVALQGDVYKAQIAFQRVFERKMDTPYVLPQLTSSSNTRVKAQVEGVTSEGSAVFDTKWGYLDTLNEDYTVKMKYISGKESLSQDVRVQYKLKRLAPIPKD